MATKFLVISKGEGRSPLISFSACGEARPTTNEGGKLALLAVAPSFCRLVLVSVSYCCRLEKGRLAASPEATKGGLGPGRGEWPSGQKRQTVNLLKFFYAGSNPASPTCL